MSVIKNRADLLAFLREKAKYTGKDELAEVKSFIDENVELTDESGAALDVEAIWNIQPKLRLTASVTAQEQEDETRLSGAKAREDRAASAAPLERKAARHYPAENRAGNSKRDAAKKAYDARAKSQRGLPMSQRNCYFDDADQAEQAAAFFRLAIAGSKHYPQREADEEINSKSMVSNINSQGGVLVPDEFMPTVIDLRRAYGGILGTIVPIQPMPRDSMWVPRQTGNLTVYNVAQAATITKSDLSLDSVRLVADKLATATAISSELFNDAAVSVSDMITKDIVWSFEKNKETDYLLGDGTSTYHGFVGVCGKARQVLEDYGSTWTTDAHKLYLAGFASAASSTWAGITLANFEDVMGKFPMNTMGGEPVWVCSRAFYFNVMHRLAYGVGGVTATEVVDGVTQYRFLGHRVIFSNAMPSVTAIDTVCCLFGDFAAGSKVGEVRGSMSIATSTEVEFYSDQIAVRGLVRYAQSVHDVGNANSTAASRVAGPICGLITLHS